jgi:hypothetical protein
MTTMQIVCCYCGHVIGTKEGHGQSGPTGGICNACLWLHYPQYAPEIMAERYGDSRSGEIETLEAA